MATNGMYSNEPTLHALPYILNIELAFLSAVVRDGRLLVASINSITRASFTLDHFAEVLRNQDYFE